MRERRLSKLNILSVRECSCLADRGLSIITSSFTSLERLELKWFPSLTVMDLRPLVLLREVAPMFLCRCQLLRIADLSGLSHVRKIGDNFLSECESLTCVNISRMSCLEEIGDGFLFLCSSLATIDLGGLSNLRRIGSLFLYQCSRVTSVDFSGMPELDDVGDCFLTYCDALETVDFGVVSLKPASDFFLGGCKSLRSVRVRYGSRIETFLATRDGKNKTYSIIEAA